MECAPADLRLTGRPENDRCRVDRRASLRGPFAERSHAGDRRRVLVCRGVRALRRAHLAARYAAHPPLPAHARRDPVDSTGATVGGSTGAGVESASVMKNRKAALAAALALVGLPVVIVPIEAFSFYSANRDNGSFVSSGEKREYLLYVPKSYDRSKPTPLVISMHGAGLWGASQRDISRWNELADSKGFIVVYPSGVGGKGVRVWRAEPGNDLMKDVRFIAELIDTLEASYNIDSTRIYANGLSNGGGMSFALSCTLSHRIAAVGLVGSAQTEPWHSCKDASAVPMINFHGTDDRFA